MDSAAYSIVPGCCPLTLLHVKAVVYVSNFFVEISLRTVKNLQNLCNKRLLENLTLHSIPGDGKKADHFYSTEVSGR